MTSPLRIKHYRPDGWVQTNPLLLSGEPGFELDTGRLKIGNGVDHWIDLPYVGEGGGADFSSIMVPADTLGAGVPELPLGTVLAAIFQTAQQGANAVSGLGQTNLDLSTFRGKFSTGKIAADGSTLEGTETVTYTPTGQYQLDGKNNSDYITVANPMANLDDRFYCMTSGGLICCYDAETNAPADAAFTFICFHNTEDL